MTGDAGTRASEKVRRMLTRELLLASRFGLVGITATGVHVLVVLLLIETTSLPVLAANLFAFLTAFGVSFAGNYVWTFGSPGSPKTAMRRFLLVSITAFAANTALLALLTKVLAVGPAPAAIGAAIVIPVMTFVGSRTWAFRQPRPGRARVPNTLQGGGGEGP